MIVTDFDFIAYIFYLISVQHEKLFTMLYFTIYNARTLLE